MSIKTVAEFRAEKNRADNIAGSLQGKKLSIKEQKEKYLKEQIKKAQADSKECIEEGFYGLAEAMVKRLQRLDLQLKELLNEW